VKLEAWLWAGVTIYFTVLGALYVALGGEAAGVSLLLMATGLGGLMAGWIWDWRRHHDHPRPADRGDADAGDDTGLVGVYPSASLRPLAIAVGMTAAVSGVVLGSWMTMAGVAIVASQVALLVRDADG